MTPDPSHRKNWINTLRRLCLPVLEAMAEGSLHQRMPRERQPNCDIGRLNTMRIEVVGRVMDGIAPWLALQEIADPEEAALQEQCIELFHRGVRLGTDPDHPDQWGFATYQQAVVDTAFLAQALLRAPHALYEPLDEQLKQQLLAAMALTRDRKPGFNNWLLFSACTEAWFHHAGTFADLMRIDYALRQHEQWYLGDGTYSDGPRFHNDFYNSFVIQPMMLDVLETTASFEQAWQDMLPKLRQRMMRHAQIQERLIAADGTWPVIGRSITYRTGAFHLLATAAWRHLLPADLHPASVRCALHATIARTLDDPKNFDADGWLRIGLSGSQPSLGEDYITTASLYLATFVFAPLGLPENDPFWAAPAQPWTARRIWELGEDMPADHAVD